MTEPQLQELSPADCRQLLATHHFGRLAFLDQVGVLPMITPVNYLLYRGQVVFRTDPGSKLVAAMHDRPVAFEIDGIDEQQRLGWSVLVRGHVEEVTDKIELAELGGTPLVAWAPGAKAHYVRVNTGKVSGRQITLTDLPANWLG